MSEWQPIESAPRDGTAFLAWGYLHDDGGPHEPDGTSFMGETPRSLIAYRCAQYDLWRERDGGCSYAGLTHWMPLPDPPAAT